MSKGYPHLQYLSRNLQNKIYSYCETPKFHHADTFIGAGRSINSSKRKEPYWKLHTIIGYRRKVDRKVDRRTWRGLSISESSRQEREVRNNHDVSGLQEVFKRISVVESRGRKCFWLEARRGCWPSVSHEDHNRDPL